MGDIPSSGDPDSCAGAMPQPAITRLAFHHDGKLLNLTTRLVSVRPFSALEEANKQLLLKPLLASAGDGNGDGDPEHAFVFVTDETIFHPQGGGQPSDEGELRIDGLVLSITAVRMDAVHPAQVLHLGRLLGSGQQMPDQPDAAATMLALRPGAAVEQAVDADKRLLYSRLHTAGHVLGSAVRHLLEREVVGFDELKASHFPDSAACEFQGLIDGKWKPQIQARVDDYVDRAMPVRIEFWTEDDFRREGLERLIPDRALLAPGESRFRVVRIEGAEVYPCGGTHVDTTDLCGQTTVKKISRRQKEKARSGYQ
ncbi:Alanyl-tRNA editing protein AlaX-L [Escovopsis weberi]|uniref:Alanyl-tRNA editing protein AlaX-L n=1 Tax=Escovopsis weberi TaxID=150374 RepID=A0A0N0RU81_ESCWE|nr:Alanyl-tRNA editing protein AlaX-L [Escovopsis weberi]